MGVEKFMAYLHWDWALKMGSALTLNQGLGSSWESHAISLEILRYLPQAVCMCYCITIYVLLYYYLLGIMFLLAVILYFY